MNDTAPPTPQNKHSRGARHRAGRILLRFLLRAQPRMMLLGALLAACTTVMGSALLGLSGWFITATAIAGLSVGSALAFDVFMPSAGIRLLAIGRTGSRYAERLVTHDATLGALVDLRERLFRGWAQPDAAQALRLRPARLLFRLTHDLDALQALYLRMLVPLAAAGLTAAFAGIAIGFVSLGLGIALFFWLAAGGLGITWRMLRQSIHPSARSAQTLERLRSQTIDMVAGQTDLLMADRLHAQRAQLLRMDALLAEQERTLNRVETTGGAAMGILQTLGLTTALLASAWLVQQKTATAPATAFILLLMLTSAEPFAALRRGALDAGRTWLATRRLAQHLDDAPSSASPMIPANAGTMLFMQDVSHMYAPHTTHPLPALQHISLCVRRAEHWAIVGSSGSGKSTLLGLIAGELRLQSGVLQARPACWLTQRTELFQDSVRANLNLTKRPLADDDLWAALDCAGLSQDIRATAKGLDTVLGEGGLGLSGGQARRLALARLFLAKSDFWLLDEPTEGLDTATASDVMQRLQAHAHGKTLLIATHLQREAALATRLLVLQHGRIQLEASIHTPAFASAYRQLRTG